MFKDIGENKQELLEDNQEENIEKNKEKKEWKDIISLPDDLDFEIH
jgi:hypothetical protein